MNKNSTLFTVLGVMGIIFGIIASITIIGLIFGIPILIGANKFFAYSKLTDQEILESDRQGLIVWLVVFMIILFPVGLIGLVILFNLESNTAQTFTPVAAADTSFDDKMKKVKDLHQMKEEGIISEEDFQNAKSKILND